MPVITEKQRLENRKKLLNCTYRLYNDNGEKMTTQMVCTAAKVGKGTLFNYFATKDVLLHEAYIEANENASRLTWRNLTLTKEKRDIVKQLIVNATEWPLKYPDEVLFCHRYYNDLTHQDIYSDNSAGKFKTPFDAPGVMERLLDGVEIDGYYMIDYTAMGTINDALGGVPVKINYDMEHIHPEWKKGATVVLHGNEAQDFVQVRMNVGEGTNVERMDRQNEFMSSAVKCMNQKISANPSFGEGLLSQLQDLSTSNMTTKRLAEELVKAHDYEVLPVEHPEGEHVEGEDGFTEFHMKDGAAVDWVLEHMYSRE